MLKIEVLFDNGKSFEYFTDADKDSLEACINDRLLIRVRDYFEEEIIINLSKVSAIKIHEKDNDEYPEL